MFSNPSGITRALQSFRIENQALCYSTFVPKLYNWCLKLGFTRGSTMPSRAFCSDESQGVPIILLSARSQPEDIVLGLEVSRLARNSADWQRLLELCALRDNFQVKYFQN